MTEVYDDAAEHTARLPGDVPSKAAATHIGMYFAWCVARGLASDWHDRTHPGELGQLERRWISGRDYVLRFMDGRLTSEHLGPEGGSFTRSYVASGTFLRDYEGVLRGQRPSLYHVPDTWQELAALQPVLDRRFDAWQAAGAGAAPPVPVVAPAPPPVSVGPPPPPPRPPPLPPRASSPAVARRARPAAGARSRTGKGAGWLLIVGFALLYGFFRAPSCASRLRRDRQPDYEVYLRGEDGRGWRRQIEQRARETRNTAQPRPPETLPAVGWGELDPGQSAAARDEGVPVRFENALRMRFVLIPRGAFVMGSSPTEPERHDGEVQHNVVITRPFYLQTSEVCNALYRRFRERHRSETPLGFQGFDLAHVPVTSVSFESAQEFCVWLSEQLGDRTYRLPTEAEWEYACRAGSATRFPWGEAESQGAYHGNMADISMRLGLPGGRVEALEHEAGWRWWPAEDGDVGLASVGSHAPSAWGLYDMIGNVYEWCADWAAPYDLATAADPVGPAGGTLRIIRGGAADAPVWKARSAWRGAWAPHQTSPNLGFRVACSVP